MTTPVNTSPDLIINVFYSGYLTNTQKNTEKPDNKVVATATSYTAPVITEVLLARSIELDKKLDSLLPKLI